MATTPPVITFLKKNKHKIRTATGKTKSEKAASQRTDMSVTKHVLKCDGRKEIIQRHGV